MQAFKKRFANTCKFPNHDIHKFNLVLQKSIPGWFGKLWWDIIIWKIICGLDPAHLFFCTSLKKTKVKLDQLTDTDMLLIVEKCITGGMCHAIHW